MYHYSVSAQRVYLADTAFATDVGYGGAEASCEYTGGYVGGWTMYRGEDIWLADSFTIPVDSAWIFDTVIVYGIQRYSGTTSTFLDCNLQIYNSSPADGGRAIWGDTVTNVLASTGFTGIYRVDTSASLGGLTGTDRPIMYLKLYLNLAPVLSAGTYWLSWSAVGTLSDSSTTTSPPKGLPGRINPPGQGGEQLSDGLWDYTIDNGQTEGFNKIIKASAGLESVPNISRGTNHVLSQNAPNPFSGTTSISFYLPAEGYAKLCVYSIVGQLVATLIDGNMSEGKHEVTFNAGDLPSGTYYYKLSTNSVSVSRQMLLIK